jgi:NAD dependent epimerase/dehydratase family enzyme
VRRGLGGQASDGRQYISWIHEQDFVRALQWLIDTPSLDGAVSIAAPEPLPNAAFMRILRETCGMPFGLPASRWMLEIGAFVMGSETELLLKSRRVVPGRLTASGFQFTLPTWQAACQELYLHWKEGA